MVLSKIVDVVLTSRNIIYYESKGYDILRKLNRYKKLTVPRGSTLQVKVEDLQEHSNVLVDWKCDRCGKIEKRNFNNCRSLCKSCVGMGELNNCFRGWKSKPKCVDCGKRIAGYYAKRCKSCRGKVMYLEKERLEKWKKTNLEKGIWKTPDERSRYERYRLRVNHETNKYKKALFENWDGTDYYTGEMLLTNDEFQRMNPGIHPNRNLKQPTIDHKVSVNYGFVNGLSVKEIARSDNLCVTSRLNNSKKHRLTDREFGV